jgi:8-oxo-dGTP pyrophosphatase MutT (NUDIX family)
LDIAGWHYRGMTTSSDRADRVRALQAGLLRPVEARPAATVALVRDGDDGLEVYLLRRVRGMSFAANMHVFPGGSVDPSDGPAGPAVSISAFVTAAVREAFEECGVLLAGPSATELVDDVSGPEWESERVALEAGRQSLAELLSRRGLVLRPDLLAPVAHWITPEVEPRRYDTHFFAAALPPHQQARTAGTEADLRLWIPPAQALAEGLKMMAPTRAVLQDLACYPTVAAALSADRQITTVRPRAELDGDQVRIVI